MEEFSPRLIGFLCNWCSYAGADLAGFSRTKYEPYMRIIWVLCSGRLDPYVIVSAFEKGADGVWVTGCHPGDCHYVTGNLEAERKVNTTRKILKAAGIDERRLGLEWISAAEGLKFARVVDEFTALIKELGPLKVDPQRIKAAKEEVADFRIRWLVGRERELLEKGNVFGEQVPKEKFENLMDNIVETQFVRNSILTALKEKPMSVKELAEKIGVPSERVIQNVIQLARGQKVQIVDSHPLRYEVIQW
ncbi:MAG: hydrogenase iron-sulfur subunit [Theionarchaea archaeon]|nr:hydrogenase iron-sulfur subunit [Theionarchaea archaeon]